MLNLSTNRNSRIIKRKTFKKVNNPPYVDWGPTANQSREVIKIGYTKIYSSIIVFQKYIGTSINVDCATRCRCYLLMFRKKSYEYSNQWSIWLMYDHILILFIWYERVNFRQTLSSLGIWPIGRMCQFLVREVTSLNQAGNINFAKAAVQYLWIPSLIGVRRFVGTADKLLDDYKMNRSSYTCTFLCTFKIQ